MSERVRTLRSQYKETRGLLAIVLIILNLGQAELAPYSPNYHTSRRTLNLDRFNVHRPPLHGRSSVTPGYAMPKKGL
ncbi:hypothetical protein TNCV_2305051 [Trichonephila clavipes]|nr:hypothetical protein TNCV_2305051 [Trichonephila clavipes]